MTTLEHPGLSTPSMHTDPRCPLARAVDIIGDRWSLLLIHDAQGGTRAFSDFQRHLGVAKNVLTDRLRRLEDRGVLQRQTAASGKRQEYVLTESGRRLVPVIEALREWGEAHTVGPSRG